MLQRKQFHGPLGQSRDCRKWVHTDGRWNDGTVAHHETTVDLGGVIPNEHLARVVDDPGVSRAVLADAGASAVSSRLRLALVLERRG